MTFFKTAIAACLTVLISGAAYAAPILWTVHDFALDDGGQVTGSYVYDADTEVFSDVMLATTGGGVFASGASFSLTGIYGSASAVDTYETYPADLIGVRSLYFALAGNMTNAGGMIEVLGYESANFGRNIVEGICADVICDDYDETMPGRGPADNATPYVFGKPTSPVPLPAGLPLLLVGLGVLGLAKRRR